ncbi:formin-like protein 5 isoform X1 [Iris pallida]|uniref:Formin-like protein 5 isoform X1 n=1 Tax=Iris pallida TaxID=29817 RepID=A0AAX6EYZ3_IRIPA|nr:formin-like protein 5 isoform X1 [Iris pallida]
MAHHQYQPPDLATDSTITIEREEMRDTSPDIAAAQAPRVSSPPGAAPRNRRLIRVFPLRSRRTCPRLHRRLASPSQRPCRVPTSSSGRSSSPQFGRASRTLRQIRWTAASLSLSASRRATPTDPVPPDPGTASLCPSSCRRATLASPLTVPLRRLGELRRAPVSVAASRQETPLL